MKIIKSIGIEQECIEHLKSKSNVSKYINNLIKNDMEGSNNLIKNSNTNTGIPRSDGFTNIDVIATALLEHPTFWAKASPIIHHHISEGTNNDTI
jgi:hypothetical protein